MPVKQTTTEPEISLVEMIEHRASFCVVSRSPFIFNRMAEKAKRQLLLPGPRMNEAERQSRLKHDPDAEFRASVYKWPKDDHPTRLKIPTAAFKGAMMTAALDTPKLKKTEIGRLVSMPWLDFDFYGVPKLLMSVVRSADINHTPDIRSRAIVPEWCAKVDVSFLEPKLRVRTIATLMGTSGLVAGVGDWRQEKGSGSFGMYELCDVDDPTYQRIVKTGGRAAQDKALQTIECYDEETEELLAWYRQEILERGPSTPSPGGRRRKRANDNDQDLAEAA